MTRTSQGAGIREVRAAAQKLERAGKSPFGNGDLADLLGIQDYRTKRLLGSGPVCELVRSGEMERVSRGRYRYLGKDERPTCQEVMWRLLQNLKRLSVEDLALMTGAGLGHVRNWLALLEKRGLARREGNKYVLIDESAEMPRNEAKAAYLRRRYEQKKKALAKLDAALGAVAEARMAVSDMEEGI